MTLPQGINSVAATSNLNTAHLEQQIAQLTQQVNELTRFMKLSCSPARNSKHLRNCRNSRNRLSNQVHHHFGTNDPAVFSKLRHLAPKILKLSRNNSNILCHRVKFACQRVPGKSRCILLQNLMESIVPERHTVSPIQPFASIHERFQNFHVDLVAPLPPSDGLNYLLTCIDRYTRWLEGIPLSDMSAQNRGKKLHCSLVSLFGVISILTIDQGRQSQSYLFSSLKSMLGTQSIRTTPYHPSSNGMVERFHRSFNVLSKFFNATIPNGQNHY
ncbi:retrovirus-related Pol polyprotein from transposon 412 [Nephila pilipes]|uniref:Retrovirus-related Pol polyprotein from transposon 412 n=1 Tax=Nephila pilipes TaxID=299642 RepID=A0A8X6UJQ8_NEPPI|nr:retrovirus-related Pol polyprotein from transposon 412 [Nephila pilipes]